MPGPVPRGAAFIAALTLLSACGGADAPPAPAPVTPDPAAPAAPDRAVRDLDPADGRALFVSKGCVLCHAVNGVGGRAAPALDAPTERALADPLDFAARMWRGAPAMIELQGLELGYTIWLEADELGDLAAFAANAEEQRKLSADAIPEPMRGSLLDERYWEAEDWSDFLESGQTDYE